MALLVCYCDPGEPIDLRRKAIYLDQKFYELLIQYCRKSIDSRWLKKIASLGYGDKLRLLCSDMEQLLLELNQLRASNAFTHAQLHSLIEILGLTIDKKLDLVVSGDMYPDKSKRFWFFRQF